MGVKNENAIYDRHGNRIRIWIGNDDEEVELDKEKFELIVANLHNRSMKKDILYFMIKYPFIITLIIKKIINFDLLSRLGSRMIGEIIRRAVLKYVLKLGGYPNNLKVEICGSTLSFNDAPVLFSDLFWLIGSIILYDQYNMQESSIKNKIVVDAGANVGIFSIYAAVLGAKKVYAFEPVKETYDILVENIKRNGLENQILPINKGLGNKNEIKIISYRYCGDGGANISAKKNKELKNQSAVLIPLDDFVKENNIERIDFIKMDTEGYEENVLLGAKETIKRWKPILSFSAYHKPTDKERLPKIVKSIRPDYKITLNKFSEEDFYCE